MFTKQLRKASAIIMPARLFILLELCTYQRKKYCEISLCLELLTKSAPMFQRLLKLDKRKA